MSGGLLVPVDDLVIGSPSGPCEMEGKVEECFRGGGWFESGVVCTADVLRVEAEGVFISAGNSSLGIVVGGRSSSEYTSRRISERPIIAAG